MSDGGCDSESGADVGGVGVSQERLESLTDELRGLRALETELRTDLNSLKIQ